MQIELKWYIFPSVQHLLQIVTLKRKMRQETGLLNASLTMPDMPLETLTIDSIVSSLSIIELLHMPPSMKEGEAHWGSWQDSTPQHPMTETEDDDGVAGLGGTRSLPSGGTRSRHELYSLAGLEFRITCYS